MELEKRLQKARTALVLDHPFVGNIALNMTMRLDSSVPTAATNGEEVIFNPEFVASLTDDELKFLVAHECFHPMLEHCFRRNGRDFGLWNMAGDFVINQLLHEDNIGVMPEGGCYDNDLYQRGEGTTDRIYSILQQEQPPQPDQPDQPGDDGDGDGDGDGPSGDGQSKPGKSGKPSRNGQQALDDCNDNPAKDPAEQSQREAEWKVKVAQAAQAAKIMGKMSAAAQRLVDEVLTHKVPWQEVLRDFVVKCRDDSRTWSRPNRRMLSHGLYLPSVSGEAMGDMVVAIDCSGSIGQAELNQFAAEIRKIKEDIPPSCLHVLYFDSKVCHHDQFDREDELHIEPHGGGGTDFAPIFQHMVDHGIDADCCVVLTDMCCTSFGNEPGCPVLWVSTEDNSYCGREPFGQLICM